MITIENKINPFLIVPKLYSDESLESFLWRLSYANGYDSLDWLKIFNLKKSLKKQGLNFIVDDSFYEQLSQFVGINKNELKKHTYLQCLRPFYSVAARS